MAQSARSKASTRSKGPCYMDHPLQRSSGHRSSTPRTQPPRLRTAAQFEPQALLNFHFSSTQSVLLFPPRLPCQALLNFHFSSTNRCSYSLLGCPALPPSAASGRATAWTRAVSGLCPCPACGLRPPSGRTRPAGSGRTPPPTGSSRRGRLDVCRHQPPPARRLRTPAAAGTRAPCGRPSGPASGLQPRSAACWIRPPPAHAATAHPCRPPITRAT
jgi:hypothetical protein